MCAAQWEKRRNKNTKTDITMNGKKTSLQLPIKIVISESYLNFGLNLFLIPMTSSAPPSVSRQRKNLSKSVSKQDGPVAV